MLSLFRRSPGKTVPIQAKTVAPVAIPVLDLSGPVVVCKHCYIELRFGVEFCPLCGRSRRPGSE